MRFPATPGWGPPAVVVCGSPPLLARACWFLWGVSWVGMSPVVCVCGVCGCVQWPCCNVCCVFVVSALLVLWCGGAARVCLQRSLVCVVLCVWCAGGPWFVAPASFDWGLRLVFVWVWLVCSVGPPPLLAGVRRCALVVGPLHSWLRGLVAGPRHSWLKFAGGCGGWSLATPGRGPSAWFPATPGWGPPVVVVGAHLPLLAVGPRVPFSLAPVCVCVLCGTSCWCGWRAGVVRGVVAVCVHVCACGVWFVECVIPWLVLVVSRHGCGHKAEEKQKKRPCRCVAEMRDMRNANTYLSICFTAHFSPCRERACAGCWGLVGCGAGAAVLPLFLWSLFFLPI